jgi:hypothetical protein
VDNPDPIDELQWPDGGPTLAELFELTDPPVYGPDDLEGQLWPHM